MLHQKKKVGARIDTKLKPNSAQKVMGLAVTSLLENSKTNKSGNSNNDMKLFLHHKEIRLTLDDQSWEQREQENHTLSWRSETCFTKWQVTRLRLHYLYLHQRGCRPSISEGETYNSYTVM
uniref:Uncharacterized protein n=1 Tax=Rhizophagus irregularis (strain DAOM 181602 / DAOM 197198 / MUCL 43194) TaxID=747089 RepID=U9TX76_RHIID